MTSSSRQLPLHLHPRPVRATIRRLADSQAAADLRRNWVFVVGTVTILTCAFLVGILSGDYVLTWHGFETIPVPADTVTPCGDYCGTDADFLLP